MEALWMFQGCGPKIYTFIRGTTQLQVLRFLAVAMGVAQILAMVLTLMLLWALSYGTNCPGLNSLGQPSILNNSGSAGASAQAWQVGCYHKKAAVTATSQQTEPQLQV